MDYSKLNQEQAQAVRSDSSRILILAGAGTGKTATLTSRMVRLYEDGVLPKQMLALTFTRAAGQEMKGRVMKQIGPTAKDIFCNTFHAFAVKLIQRYAHHIGYNSYFTIYDDDDKLSVIEGIINDYQYKHKPKDIIKTMNKMYVYGIYPQGEEKHIINEYRFQLKRDNAMDFDMLIESLRVLLLDDEIRDYVHNKYTHIFVDEFQDSDRRQIEILRAIDPQNLFLVGDDFQSIYSFSGADVSIIMDISQDPEYEVIKLERNYRSTRPIIDAANTLIKYNEQTEKVLKTEVDGRRIDYVQTETQDDEADSIAASIKSIMDAGIDARQIAVLTRTNKAAEAMAQGLLRNDVPAELKVTVRSVLQNADIKHLMSWMEAVVNPNNDRAVRDCLTWPKPLITYRERMIAEKCALEHDCSLLAAIRGVKDQLISGREFIELYDSVVGAEAISWSATFAMYDIVKALDLRNEYHKKKLENRIANLDALEKIMLDWETQIIEAGEENSALEWIRYYKLMQIDGMTEEEEPEPAVQVMTAHKSKGLEYDTVFVTGCNNKTFPLSRGDIKEERRLFYVAMTRAKAHLILTRAMKRPLWNGGPEQATEPSQFIEEMGLETPSDMT